MLFKWLISLMFLFNSCISEVKNNNCYIPNTNTPMSCKPVVRSIENHATIETTNTCIENDRICLRNTINCFKCNRSINNINRLLIKNNGWEFSWISDKINNNYLNNVVNITVNFDTLYEIDFIVMKLCGEIPDGIVLYYSSDFGVTYKIWSYFSYTCRYTFGMPKFRISKMKNLNEPFCFPYGKQFLPALGAPYRSLPYNPKKMRKSNNTAELEERATITNFKISLIRKKIYLTKPQNGRLPKKRKKIFTTKKYDRFCLTDLDIVGELQCYGHGNLVKSTSNMGITSFKCNCNHGTTGIHCEKCKETHNDKQWQPMWLSEDKGNTCKKCFCNYHSQRCTFNATIWEMSKEQHGSQCIDCQHNTTGAQCEICANGFYRDAERPISHPLACKKCNCIGSGVSNTICNPITGSCLCRVGVAGRYCNRCSLGYTQTDDISSPCKRMEIMVNEGQRCDSCNKNSFRIKKKKYCRNHLMMKIVVQSSLIGDRWTKYGVKVPHIYRFKKVAKRLVPYLIGASSNSSYWNYPIWVPTANVRCNCPKLELGKEYLVLTKITTKLNIYNQRELVISKQSIVLKWRDNWIRRLEVLRSKEPTCKALLDKIRNKRKSRRFRRRQRNQGSYYQGYNV